MTKQTVGVFTVMEIQKKCLETASITASDSDSEYFICHHGERWGHAEQPTTTTKQQQENIHLVLIKKEAAIYTLNW